LKNKPIYLSKSLKKSLTILNLFNERIESLRITDISKSLKINPSTLYPILSTLEKFGYIERNENDKKYSLGFEYLNKSELVLRRLDVRECAQPYLKELLYKCNENVHMGILDKNQNKVIYVDRKEASPSLTIHSFIGKKVPLYCTALGKVLMLSMDENRLHRYLESEKFIKFTDHTIVKPSKILEEIEKVEKDGFATDNEEFQNSGICIAVPIKSYQKKIVAALSVSIHKNRFSNKSTFSTIKCINVSR